MSSNLKDKLDGINIFTNGALQLIHMIHLHMISNFSEHRLFHLFYCICSQTVIFLGIIENDVVNPILLSQLSPQCQETQLRNQDGSIR